MLKIPDACRLACPTKLDAKSDGFIGILKIAASSWQLAFSIIKSNSLFVGCFLFYLSRKS